MQSRASTFFDIAADGDRPALKLPNIAKVGIELEGAFNTDRVRGTAERYVEDHSVKYFPRGEHFLGELPSPAFSKIPLAERWVVSKYPNMVNGTCGYHIHISTPSLAMLGLLQNPAVTRYLHRMLVHFHNTLGIRYPHTCNYKYHEATDLTERAKFKNNCHLALDGRLRGESNFCREDVQCIHIPPRNFKNATYRGVADRKVPKEYIKSRHRTVTRMYMAQASAGTKSRPNRYAMLNFTNNYLGTVEMRMFPMFCTSDLALTALRYYLLTINHILERELSQNISVSKDSKDLIVEGGR